MPAGNAVTVTNPGNQTGAVGTAIAGLQVQATDSAAGQSLAYTAAGLPAGLSISSSGLISGTPTAAGTSNVTVTATDSTGASGTTSFTWTVSGGGGGTCQVSYTKKEWGGGFTANLTITDTDTGTAPVNGWTLTFSFPGAAANQTTSRREPTTADSASPVVQPGVRCRADVQSRESQVPAACSPPSTRSRSAVALQAVGSRRSRSSSAGGDRPLGSQAPALVEP